MPFRSLTVGQPEPLLSGSTGNHNPRFYLECRLYLFVFRDKELLKTARHVLLLNLVIHCIHCFYLLLCIMD